MLDDITIANHYMHGSLLEAIKAALPVLGKTLDNITVEDLSPVDEFHIGGRVATEHLINQLNIDEQDHLLDVGCGLGGASRFVANQYGNQVTGIDLTQEYIETGTTLCSWLKLEKQVTLKQGNALSMPFQDSAFDGAYMLHVGMNIDDKAQLFTEIHRVLRSGASFAVYDIMINKGGELAYPVPWATDSSTSKLATPEQYKEALKIAGFEIITENNRRDFSLEFFKQMKKKAEENGGPPPLGLHTLMKETTADKIKNMVDNIAKDYIFPIEIIARKI